jgi:hypothetical protein
VVVGLFLIVGLGVATVGVGLVARFGLHSMGGFDAQMTEQIRQSTKSFEQQALQQKSAPIPPGWLDFMRTSEFRAGMMLIVFAFFAAVLLAFSTLGGAFAGLLRTRRRTA